MKTPYSECLKLGYVLHKLAPSTRFVNPPIDRYRYKTFNVADESVTYYKTLASVNIWIKLNTKGRK